MKVVAIVGSPRPEGNSSCLVDMALEELKNEGIDTRKVLLVNHQIGWCLGHVDCGSSPNCLHDRDDAAAIVEDVFSADGIILATPVQMQNVSALMKNFMDRTRFKRRQKIKMPARSVGLIAVAANTGMEDTLARLQRYVVDQSELPAEKMHTLSGKAGNPGEAKQNPELTKQAREMGKKMAAELKQTAKK